MARGGIPRRAAANRAPQRQFIWSNVIVQTESVAGGATKTTGNISATGASGVGGTTLIRTRGSVMVAMDPGAAGDAIIVGLGLCVVSTDAFTAGSASLPGPISDVDFDWFWHSLYALGPSSGSAELETSIRSNLWQEIDSKAMRKLKPNQTMAFMSEATILSGSPTYDLNAAVRQLVKLG